MTVVVVTFKPDHKGIEEFLLSHQLREAVREGARDVAAIANNTAGITKIRGAYDVESGPNVVVTKNGNPRLSEHVVNHHPAAAADEFGSGSGAEGQSKGEGRKKSQGGGSPANRTLGKAGARIADRIGGSDD